MKLHDNCPFAVAAIGENDADEIDRSECCRRLGWYWLNWPEEPLCRSRGTEEEAYRFSWQSSFNGDASVHIGRNDRLIRLCWHKFGTPAAFAPLSLDDWHELQKAIDAARFWSLESGRKAIGGFDGAQWLIEGRRRNDFHALQRWSPGGAIQELGRLFFALAGPPLACIEPY